MQSKKMAAAVAAVGVIVVVILFVALRDDDGGNESSTTQATTTTEATTADGGGGGNDKPEPPPEPQVPTIVVKNGEPVGGVVELDLAKGDRIAFVVESDVDEEIHLHGYDVSKEISAGGKVAFDVPATIEGVFEAELEESAVPIAEITVNPG